LPSATEIVYALGLGDELVGVTHECDWPPEATSKPILTRSVHDLAARTPGEIHRLVEGTIHGGSSLYALDEAALAAAAPDLILTQELCRVCAVSYREVNEVARAIDADITVVSLEPTSIEGILETISTVGAMTEAEDAAVEVVGGLRERLATVGARVLDRRDAGRRSPRVVAVEWLDPPFAAGHWVPEQVRRAGGWEVLGQEGARSVESSWAAVAELDPERIVLMPCGYHVADGLAAWAATKRPPGWQDLAAVRAGAVDLVDASAYFSRPGPRVVDGIELLAELFDPEGFEGLAPAGSWALAA
jgi:iron complex transport system substrate-binding protein